MQLPLETPGSSLVLENFVSFVGVSCDKMQGSGKVLVGPLPGHKAGIYHRVVKNAHGED